MVYHLTLEQKERLRVSKDSYSADDCRNTLTAFERYLATPEGRMALEGEKRRELADKLRAAYTWLNQNPWNNSREHRYLTLALDYFLREYDFVPDSQSSQGLDDDLAVVNFCLQRIGFKE